MLTRARVIKEKPGLSEIGVSMGWQLNCVRKPELQVHENVYYRDMQWLLPTVVPSIDGESWLDGVSLDPS